MAKTPVPPTLILYLSRQTMSLCSNEFPVPVTLTLPQTVQKDLDVVSQVELGNAITAFLAQHKLAPSTLVIVLSHDAYFDRDLTGVLEKDRDNTIAEFVAHVPFTSTSFKVFSMQKGDRLVVINRELYDSIKAVFERGKFTVAAVIPELVLEPIGMKGEFSQEVCRILLKKLGYLKEHSFTTNDNADGNLTQQERRFISKHQAVMASFSVVSILLAGFTMWATLRHPSSQQAARAGIAVAPVPTVGVRSSEPTITPAASPTPVPEELLHFNVEALSFMVLNGSKTPGLATKLAGQLRELGFTSVQTGNASTAPAHTSVVFSTTIPQAVQEKILNEIQKAYPDASSKTLTPEEVKESGSTGDFDIIITVAG